MHRIYISPVSFQFIWQYILLGTNGIFFSWWKFSFRFSCTAQLWLFIIDYIFASLLNRVCIDFYSISICRVLAWLDSISVNANDGNVYWCSIFNPEKQTEKCMMKIFSIHNEFLRFCWSLDPVVKVQKVGFLKFDIMTRTVIHTSILGKVLLCHRAHIDISVHFGAER